MDFLITDRSDGDNGHVEGIKKTPSLHDDIPHRTEGDYENDQCDDLNQFFSEFFQVTNDSSFSSLPSPLPSPKRLRAGRPVERGMECGVPLDVVVRLNPLALVLLESYC